MYELISCACYMWWTNQHPYSYINNKIGYTQLSLRLSIYYIIFVLFLPYM